MSRGSWMVHSTVRASIRRTPGMAARRSARALHAHSTAMVRGGFGRHAVDRSGHRMLTDHRDGMNRLIQALPAQGVALGNPGAHGTRIEPFQDKAFVAVAPVPVQDSYLGRAAVKTARDGRIHLRRQLLFP